MYGVFECPNCGGRWANVVPAYWGGDWPSCQACCSRSLLELTKEGGLGRPKLMWLLLDRDHAVQDFPCRAVRAESIESIEPPEPVTTRPRRRHARLAAFMAVVACRAIPLTLIVPSLLMFN